MSNFIFFGYDSYSFMENYQSISQFFSRRYKYQCNPIKYATKKGINLLSMTEKGAGV